MSPMVPLKALLHNSRKTAGRNQVFATKDRPPSARGLLWRTGKGRKGAPGETGFGVVAPTQHFSNTFADVFADSPE
jgi:hypothetical protein